MDSIPQDNPLLKRCYSCPEGQQWHPATTEYFTRNKSKKDGLQAQCKVCRKAYRARPEIRKQTNAYLRNYWISKGLPSRKLGEPRVGKAITREYRQGYKCCTTCPEDNQWHPATP